MFNIESRLLWRHVKIDVVTSDGLEEVIDKYWSAGAGAAKELEVTSRDLKLNEDHIILLATKFKKLKKLRLVTYSG